MTVDVLPLVGQPRPCDATRFEWTLVVLELKLFYRKQTNVLGSLLVPCSRLMGTYKASFLLRTAYRLRKVGKIMNNDEREIVIRKSYNSPSALGNEWKTQETKGSS